VALYSYKATDEDELTFEAGDVFVHVKRIDDGWMFAELETTGANGEITQKAACWRREGRYDWLRRNAGDDRDEGMVGMIGVIGRNRAILFE
jgi:hypothetical protein